MNGFIDTYHWEVIAMVSKQTWGQMVANKEIC